MANRSATLRRLVVVCLAGAISIVWNRAEPTADQASDPARVVPFTIRVPGAVLSDLKARLAHPRFPDALQADWTYGTDLAYLKALVTYWRDTFYWRAQ